jgi:hypothetical protein
VLEDRSKLYSISKMHCQLEMHQNLHGYTIHSSRQSVRTTPKWCDTCLIMASRMESFPSKLQCARAFGVLQMFHDRSWDINKPLCRNGPLALGVASAPAWARNLLTMFSIPCSISDQGMIEWFLEHNANLNACSSLGVTPVSYAMMKAPRSLAEYLFQRGADPHRGYLPHYAVLREDDVLEVVKLVVEKSVSINEKPELGSLPFDRTPLQFAAVIGNQGVVE